MKATVYTRLHLSALYKQFLDVHVDVPYSVQQMKDVFVHG